MIKIIDKLKIVSLFSSLFLCACAVAFAENNIQNLIDSGAIKSCFVSGRTLQLSNKDLQSLNGIENIANPELIKIIDLSHNKIKHLDGLLFKRFCNLAELYLNYNLIEQLSSLGNIANLRELHLPHNKLTTFDLEQFSGLSTLYVLNLGFNEINGLASKSLDSKSRDSILEVLYLNNNEIKVLPSDAFVVYPKLQALYLQDNAINLLESNCFKGLFNVRLLYLYGNFITKLPANIFVDLKQLHVLYLGNNNIQILENHWDCGLDKIKILDI